MSILFFLFILSFLVLIHELGHFITAKRQGIKVEEFGLGYPPRALTLYKDKSGTEYSLNWLPFGGFVRLFGEETDSQEAQAFGGKPAWRRMIVVLAGAFINFIFGLLVFAGVYTYAGIWEGMLPWPKNHILVEEVVPGSPAEQAQVQVGDKIVGIEVQNRLIKVTENEWFMYWIQKYQGNTIKLVLDNRPDGPLVYARRISERGPNEGAMGIGINDVDAKTFPVLELPFKGAYLGVKRALSYGLMLVYSLGDIGSGLVAQKELPAEVSGPIGIGYQVQKQRLLDQGILAALNFAAILSINLAIVNVLPLPALDGGRAAFILFEMITKKRVKPRIEHAVNTAGFAFLLALIVLISFRDIRMVLADEAVMGWFKKLIQQ